MKNKNLNNQLFTTASLFGMLGFVLMFGVIFSHGHINEQFALLETKRAKAISVKLQEEQDLEPLPEEVLEEITQSDLNIMGLETYQNYTQELSPAIKFLRDISRDIFLTQK